MCALLVLAVHGIEICKVLAHRQIGVLHEIAGSSNWLDERVLQGTGLSLTALDEDEMAVRIWCS